MTTELTPRPARRRPPRAFATPGMVRFLVSIASLTAVVAPVGGVAYAINGATQARGDVLVRLAVTDVAALRLPSGQAPGGQPVSLRQPDGPNDPGTVRLALPGVPDAPGIGASLETPLRTVTMRAADSTVAEQLLGRAGAAVAWVCVGLGAWLLRGLLLSIADADPLRRGNAGRIAGTAALVMVANIATWVFPTLAGARVLARLGLASGTPVAPLPIGFDLFPILLALVLLALAEAFRRGGDLVRDAEGLV